MDPGPEHSRTKEQSRVMDEFYGLEQSQFMAIKRAFDSRCKKGSSSIKDKELRKVMKDFGWNPTDKEMIDMLVILDPGDTSRIDFRSFIKVMAKKMQAVDFEVEIKEAYRVLDKDGNGFVSVKEFRYIMSHAVDNLLEGELQEMIEDLDRDGDGQIDYEDFAHIARYGKAFALQKLQANQADT
ncbi:neo-calmodulin-like [Amphiura filiformis]|uniref:neo-calmodulin-like n=1 Tax=Amphiura filiformis TaxID=82378 RepID=UPI003B20E4B7